MYSNDWFDKAIGANALVEADIIDAQVLEESCRRDVLIVRALKVGRETVPREVSRDLGQELWYIITGTWFSVPSTLAYK